MKKATILYVLSIVAVFIFAAATADSHRTNLRYHMWKQGWTQNAPETAIRYLNVDAKFRESLRGKTKTEVQEWFSDLRPLSAANSYQQYYNQHLDQATLLWIGESPWGIEFEDGRLKEFRLMKG
ncbi:MAG: hypothetical protein ACI8W8_001908 [Rhodothermales bacterium]|jgi:hypothetical protein